MISRHSHWWWVLSSRKTLSSCHSKETTIIVSQPFPLPPSLNSDCILMELISKEEIEMFLVCLFCMDQHHHERIQPIKLCEKCRPRNIYCWVFMVAAWLRKERRLRQPHRAWKIVVPEPASAHELNISKVSVFQWGKRSICHASSAWLIDKNGFEPKVLTVHGSSVTVCCPESVLGNTIHIE